MNEWTQDERDEHVRGKWRLVSISHGRSYGFFTLQWESYKPIYWSEATPHQNELAALIAAEEMIMSGIGDAYGKWRKPARLPSWARHIPPVPLFAPGVVQALCEYQMKEKVKK